MLDERIKDSFTRIKEDILFLQQEIVILKHEIEKIRQVLESSTRQSTDRHPTHAPAHNSSNYSLNASNFHSSIGNEGVPTDRQQTDNRHKIGLKPVSARAQTHEAIPHEISLLLDNLKQDLKEKFRKLTKQEFLIFSILYTLEQDLEQVTYKDIAIKAGLTESSVRDYISRLEKKGLPIQKEKLNNRVVVLRIPQELKNLATLDVISKLKQL